MRVTLIEELVQFKNEIATYSTYTNQACIATSPSTSSSTSLATSLCHVTLPRCFAASLCHVALPRCSNAGDTGDEVRSSNSVLILIRVSIATGMIWSLLALIFSQSFPFCRNIRSMTENNYG